MPEQNKELTALVNICLAMQISDVSAQNNVEYALHKLQQAEPLTLPASIKLKDLLNKTIESGTYDDAVQRCNSTFGKIIDTKDGLGLELFGGNSKLLRERFSAGGMLETFRSSVNAHKDGHNHDAAKACGIELSPTEITKQAEASKGKAK